MAAETDGEANGDADDCDSEAVSRSFTLVLSDGEPPLLMPAATVSEQKYQ